MTLNNSGAIGGGSASALAHHGTATGGAGAANETGGEISNLINNIDGRISGGDASAPSGAAVGGAGADNAGMIATLVNKIRGTISGGSALDATGVGGAGVSNSAGATIGKLTNSGMISGGEANTGAGNATGGAVVLTPARSRC